MYVRFVFVHIKHLIYYVGSIILMEPLYYRR